MIVHKLMSKMSTLMSGVEGACSQLVRMIALVPSSSLHSKSCVVWGVGGLGCWFVHWREGRE